MISFTVNDIRKMNDRLREFTDYLERLNVDGDAVFDCRLVSCELITNALRHCGGAASFCGALCDGGVEIKVCSTAEEGAISVPPLPDVLAESGRGLYIVNSISGGNVFIEGGNVTVIIKTKM